MLLQLCQLEAQSGTLTLMSVCASFVLKRLLSESCILSAQSQLELLVP